MRFKMDSKSLAVIVLFFAITLSAPATSQARTLVVTDVAGRAVEVPAHPRRIIAVSSGALRLLCYLEAADRIVGVESFDKKPSAGRSYQLAYPSLAGLPSIGPGGPAQINRDPDLEAVLRLSPDAIFITHMEPAKADALQKRLGIPVVVLAYSKTGVGTIDEKLYESLRLAGKILGKEKRAEAVIAFIEQNRQNLLARTKRMARDRKPTVYIGGISLKGVQGIESTDADYPPLAWVNARNLAREVSTRGHLFINREQLLAWNPDFLFLDAGGLTLIAQDYRKKPDFYQHLKVVGKKRIYLLYPFNNYATNIETMIADAYTVGKILYPEGFADLNLQKKCDEIYTFFLGKPIYGEMKKIFGDLGRAVDLNKALQTP